MLLTLSAAALAEVEKNPYLDAAFTMLEEGNLFVERYNEITGSDITPAISTGAPYFFGGQDFKLQFKVIKLTQTSKYGVAGDRYIYGFDCTGFTRWIQTQVGDKTHPGLSDMILQKSKYRDYRMDDLKEITDFTEIAKRLQVGDFVAGKHGGRHILMYIGTAADYGITAEEAPELANYLDYPLFINCGNDPNYVERTAAYIEENGLNAKPSKGGVTISIVGVHESDAPHSRESAPKEFYYFDCSGYQISVWDIYTATSYVWWRTIPKDKK